MTDDGALPVTVLVRRAITPGREADARAWASQAILAASHFPGHQGASVLLRGLELELLFRFASPAALAGWEASPRRAELLALAQAWSGPPTVQRLEGLEPFFVLPGPGPVAPPPPRWKMAVVTWLVAFPLIQALQATVGVALAHWPAVLRGALLGALMVVAMTWWGMPAATRALRGWLSR